MHNFTPKIFTILKNGYTVSDIRSDGLAGLTVAIVALPLAMALAIASGTSPDKGLITAAIAGFIISFLGGSRVQIGGPTGAFVVVIFHVIQAHGYDGLLLATFMAGIILIIAGYCRLGQVIKYIPLPVVTGFTSGIALIIASSQVKDFFGLSLDTIPAEFIPKWISYFEALSQMNLASFAIGIFSLFTIIILRRFAPKLPSFLIAVILASVIVYGFKIQIDTIGSRFPDLPSGIPFPQLPPWDLVKIRSLLPSALTIAFLAGIEALLSAVVADGMTGFKHRSDQELVGQGVANLASALFGGLPATGAIARTATNIKAGGRTPVAGIFHALFLLLFMLLAMKIIQYIPMAALASILLIVAWGMSEIGHFIQIIRLSRSDGAIMLITFSLTVMVDLTVAIGTGFTLACLLFMKHMSQSVEIRIQKESFTEESADDVTAESQRLDLPKNVEIFQITGPFFFGVASNLLETLKAMGQFPSILIIRMSLVPYLDSTGLQILGSVIQQCHNRGTTLILSGVKPKPLTMIKRLGIDKEIDRLIFAPNYKSAIEKAKDLA